MIDKSLGSATKEVFPPVVRANLQVVYQIATYSKRASLCIVSDGRINERGKKTASASCKEDD